MTASDDDPPPRVHHRIGLALSGGGVRAALFSLGVLLYMIRSGLHRDIRIITSVSGGSIPNAILASLGDISKIEAARLEDTCGRMAHHLAKRGAFFWSGFRWMWGFIALQAIGVIGVIFVIVWLTPTHLSTTDYLLVILSAVAVLLMTFIILLIAFIVPRRLLQQDTYARMMSNVLAPKQESKLLDRLDRLERLATFSSIARVGLLSELPESSVWHILCATELTSGRPIFFSRNWIYSPAYGRGPASMYVTEAVYSSAAFPGGFPPHIMKIDRMRWSGGDVGSRPERLILVDGGVYNNLGTDWHRTIEDASRTFSGIDRHMKVPPEIDLQVVVNASAPAKLASLPIWWPQRSVVNFLRTMTIMYENTLRPRLEALSEQAKRDQKTIVLDIGTSPLQLARTIKETTCDELAKERSSRLIDGLRVSRQEFWQDFVDRTSLIKTTLAAIGYEQAASLIRHGYLSATVAFNAQFGARDLNQMPDEEWFADFVGAPQSWKARLSRDRESLGPEHSSDAASEGLDSSVTAGQ